MLAFFESRRERAAGPSLVVVPKSLVFNWKQEAAQFAPKLRVLDYTGADRARLRARFADSDQVITTYGTIDRARAGEPGGKLEVLLPRLAEILDEGHKTLVFSQFTSLLAIVRSRLDRERIVYEYLDGRTRDRAACVAQ